MSIFGIDISHHQLVTNYDLLNNNSNIRFKYHKATQGVDMKDSTYLYHMNKLNGPKGAYHYYRPIHNPLVQANYFYDYASQIQLQLPPVLDIEGYFEVDKAYYKATPKTTIHKNLWYLIKETERLFKHRPLIYTGYYFWRDFIGLNSGIPNYCDLWIASYNPSPVIPSEWKTWKLWQYTDNGLIPGIQNNVDFNYFNGTEEEFKVFTGEYAPPPPPSVPITKVIKKLEVIIDGLNIRSGPSTSYPKIGSLTKNKTLWELSEIKVGNNIWAEIGYKQYADKVYNNVIFMKYVYV